MAVISRECNQRVFHNWKTLKITFLLPPGVGWSYWKVPWLSSFARYADGSHQTSDRPSKPRVRPCKRQGPSPSPYAHIDQAALLVSGLGERAKESISWRPYWRRSQPNNGHFGARRKKKFTMTSCKCSFSRKRHLTAWIFCNKFYSGCTYITLSFPQNEINEVSLDKNTRGSFSSGR